MGFNKLIATFLSHYLSQCYVKIALIFTYSTSRKFIVHQRLSALSFGVNSQSHQLLIHPDMKERTHLNLMVFRYGVHRGMRRGELCVTLI